MRSPGAPRECTRVRSSLWRQTLARYGPAEAASRFAARIRASPGSASPRDLTRLANALHAAVTLHVATPRGWCDACSHGPHLVAAPCPTRRAIEAALRADPPPRAHA